LPDERVGFDDIEAEEVVELLERELLHLIGSDADVPEILGHGRNNNSRSAGRRGRSFDPGARIARFGSV
jgi:hypothetical protein